MGCDHSLALGKKTLSLPPRVKKMFPQTGTSAAKVRGFSYGELHRKKKKAIMAHSPLRVTNTTQETPAGTTKGPASTWILSGPHGCFLFFLQAVKKFGGVLS